MRKAHVPFTLFPVVQAADERQPFWWDLAGALQNETRERYINALKGDRDAVCREYPDAVDLPDDALPASWEMYRAILDDDCSIGVHGVTHRNLTTLPAEEVVWELTHARTRVGEELAVPTDVIAYPYGRTNASVQAVAERLGFQAGLTNDSSLIREGHALFDVGRINVPGGLSIATFACWASGLKLRV
jgi:peptidoglycan/xylan/chitin deacetylase (PgdA/CDA1 family)